MTTATMELDQAKVEALEQRMLGVLNGGALALMVSLGHRAGIFDAMAELPPATSAAIAEAAGLDERYVREWLGAMVTGELVEHDAAAGTYRLPPEHAARLSRRATPANMATSTQWLAVLGSVEDRVLDCFRAGGGLGYEEYPRFHEVMAEESGQTVVAGLLEQVLPLAPDLPARLERGIDVLDIGCGSGRALLRMAEAFPRSRFVGWDLSADAVATARAQARARGLRNVTFEARDVAAAVDLRGALDLICGFDVIHDQARPAAVLANVARALRPDGLFLMQDIDTSAHLHENRGHPVAPFLYAISTMHCMSVSLGQGGAGLGTCWGHQTAERMLGEAGFARVDVRRLEHDVMNCWYLARLA